MSDTPRNSSTGPSMPIPHHRATKARSTAPGTSTFSVDNTALLAGVSPSQNDVQTPMPSSNFRFKPPVTPVSVLRPFELREDIEAGNFRRSDIPAHAHFSDPREPLAHFSDAPRDPSTSETLEDPVPFQLPTIFDPKPRISRYRKINNVLAQLHEGNISPVEVLIQVLDPVDVAYDRYRTHLYREESTKLAELVDAIMSDDAGKRKLLEVMRPHLLDFACDIVAEQMQQRRNQSFLPGIAAITPAFIDSWSIDEANNPTPFLTRILETAAQTDHARQHNKMKKPEKMCAVVTQQLLYQSSNRCLAFQAEFGLFLWATGCARQTIDALFRCGLSICYDGVLNTIESFSRYCDKDSALTALDIHAFNYDNMNLSTSIHVEQRGSSGPSKVTSGTFGVLYRLRNAVPEHMLIAPIMKRFKASPGLHFNRDIKPCLDHLVSFHDQLLIVSIHTLIKHIPGFEYLAQNPLVQHKERRAIPVGYKTHQSPTRATTIEEATVRGNLLYHDEVYLNQFHRTSASLSTYAIPSFNDQLTNARIRAAQILRAQDTNAWNRREVFQLGFGLFHLCLNLPCIFFALMEKARLGNEQPDYHTLLAALTQIHDGLMMNAWRRECGSPSLKLFAESKPSAEQLRDIATRILIEYATPIPPINPSQTDSTSDDSSSESTESTESSAHARTPTPPPPAALNPKDDVAHSNMRLLMRDLLVVAALIRAISDGDFGRIEVFLPQLSMMSAGPDPTSIYVWTPEFSDIMRDNMIICLSGLGPGHCMPMDMNIEHLIGYLKNLLQAKGMSSTWDRLGNISAAIVHLQRVKKKVAEALDGSYRNTGHTTPDTSEMVWRVANKAAGEQLQERRKPQIKYPQGIQQATNGDD
ncbi:hypothetical protein B0H14DRAFT_3177829 [Mycena olivaceomarginata]|nr:hypothetical protein B0H14DRAFT_3177829 [Mycena olivaceomarginata]